MIKIIWLSNAAQCINGMYERCLLQGSLNTFPMKTGNLAVNHKFTTMKTILVPTDFSKAANNAAEYAVRMAKEIKARLLLFHAYHFPVPPTDLPILVEPYEAQKENELFLKEKASQLKKIANVEIACVTRLGMAADEILEEEKKADFIVMGMYGAGMLEETILGSIATSVLRKARIPVLIIPEHVKYKHPEKIVLACDYRPGTDMHHLDVLKLFGSVVYVVNVKQEGEPVTVDASVEERLENKLKGIEHFYYFPEKKDAVEAITEFAEGKHADMVAVIPHHYKLMERLFHRSISKKLAFHTRIPLLALPDNCRQEDADSV